MLRCRITFGHLFVVLLAVLASYIYIILLSSTPPPMISSRSSFLKMVNYSTSNAQKRLQMLSLHLHTSSVGQTSASSLPTSAYLLKSGSKYTPEYKVYYVDPRTRKFGSYFHDVPLNLNKQAKTVSMVVEIPRWSNAKMEISKELDLNPIVQDIKKGKLRFINNIFPFKGYIHNYGAIPQTWEDSTEIDKPTGLKGDNDPIDICDIGSKLGELGEIVQVKVLGALALIDDGELDWKVIGINVDDSLAEKLNDIQDVEEHMPGVLESTRNWFRDYKVPTGKPQNDFAFNGEYKNAQEAIKVIEGTHESWAKLINGKVEGKKLPAIINTSQKDTKEYHSDFALEIPPETKNSKIPEEVDNIDYLK